jgi:exopolyphosphatase / guanosine-5'-triphosphate,3'-diphosphate pyrophosphatase
MLRQAVIEVGTNSIKFLAAEAGPRGACTILADVMQVGALGRGLGRTGTLSREAMDQNSGIICRFAALAAELGCRDVAAVGTMALRQAGNREEFAARIREGCGLTLIVLTGLEEARLTYLGAAGGLAGPGTRLVFDVGGGSTELIRGRGRRVDSLASLPLGALGLTEEYFFEDPPLPRQVRAAAEALQASLKSAGISLTAGRLIGVGGTVTSMAAVKHRLPLYDPRVVQGSTLTLAEVEGLVDLFAGQTLAKRQRLPGLAPERAPVILAGAVLVRELMKAAASPLLHVSDRGLRHGVLAGLPGGRAGRHHFPGNPQGSSSY